MDNREVIPRERVMRACRYVGSECGEIATPERAGRGGLFCDGGGENRSHALHAIRRRLLARVGARVMTLFYFYCSISSWAAMWQIMPSRAGNGLRPHRTTRDASAG